MATYRQMKTAQRRAYKRWMTVPRTQRQEVMSAARGHTSSNNRNAVVFAQDWAAASLAISVPRLIIASLVRVLIASALVLLLFLVDHLKISILAAMAVSWFLTNVSWELYVRRVARTLLNV